MLAKLFLTVALVIALLTVAFPGSATFQFAAIAACCFTALLVALQAGAEGHYAWFGGFLVMAVLLNPIMPIPLEPVPSLALMGICIIVTASWMVALQRAMPSQSIAQVLYPQDRA
jgi:hypothetical protein